MTAGRYNWRPLEEAREFARGLGLKSQTKWREWVKSGECPDDIPTNPDKTYGSKGWAGWGDWLGTGNVHEGDWRPLDEARGFVRGLGLESEAEWRAWSKTQKRPPDIPATPDQVYKGKGWAGWGDWLGTGYVANSKREFRPFEEAREFARGLGLKGVTEWREWKTSGEFPADTPS